jgi:hypothetical protein
MHGTIEKIKSVRAADVVDAIKRAEESLSAIHKASNHAKAVALWRADRDRAEALVRAFHQQTERMRGRR